MSETITADHLNATHLGKKIIKATVHGDTELVIEVNGK